MEILTGTLLTMALQVGVSYINQKNNKKTLEEIKKRQQEFRADGQIDSIRRDYKKFRHACELQLQMEEESHKERLANIDKDFGDWFVGMAHKKTLESHYPLSISPYIVKSSVLPFYCGPMGEMRKEVFCILTNSNDSVFNDNIIPALDDLLCDIISSAWNEKSMHTLCYYTNMWKRNVVYCDENIKNIKVVIKTPTITVTPFFEKRRVGYALIIKLNMWGDGIDKSVVIETDITYDSIPTMYSSSDVREVLALLYPIIICAIGENIDVYYWTNYYQPPILPSLLSKGVILLRQEKCREYGQAYMELFKTFVLGDVASDSGVVESSLLKDVSDVNQCNFPERSVGFLREVIKLAEVGPETEDLIIDTIKSIYAARTGKKLDSLASIDVCLLDKDDVECLDEIENVAMSSGNFRETRYGMMRIIRKKILLWYDNYMNKIKSVENELSRVSEDLERLKQELKQEPLLLFGFRIRMELERLEFFLFTEHIKNICKENNVLSERRGEILMKIRNFGEYCRKKVEDKLRERPELRRLYYLSYLKI